MRNCIICRCSSQRAAIFSDETSLEVHSVQTVADIGNALTTQLVLVKKLELLSYYWIQTVKHANTNHPNTIGTPKFSEAA